MGTKEPSVWLKVSVFLGIHMMGIFCNVPWVWGNLSVYCSSYFHNQSEQNMGEVAPWLVSINTIGLTVGVITCDKLRQWVSLRGALALGITLFNAGVFLSYFAVQHSLLLLEFTLGIFPGLAMGIIQACQYTLVVRWTTFYQGLATSSVESTCVLGSVFINQIITFYINPDNVISDLEVGPTKLFSQKEILDKVPSVFLVYGAVSLTANCIGFFLLARDNPGDDMFLLVVFKKFKGCIGGRCTTPTTTSSDDDDDDYDEKTPLKLSNSNGNDVTSTTIAPTTIIVRETDFSNDDDNNDNNNINNNNRGAADSSGGLTRTERYDADIENMIAEYRLKHKDSIRSVERSFSQKAAIVESSGIWVNASPAAASASATSASSPNNDDANSDDKGPKYILKTRVFYTLWLTMAVADFTFIVLTTYYKAFGLVYITDDHFLTYCGTLMCVAIAVISYAGGIAVDRFGVKDAIVCFVTVMGVISSLFYISPSIDKWIYLIFCTIYGAFDFGIVCVLSSCALKLWGQTHLSTNYGLILSSCVITNTALPPVIELVILTYGWLALFTTLSVCIICCVFMCIWQIPRT